MGKMSITNTQVFGFEGAFRGMRNPFDSWDKTDSYMCKEKDSECFDECACHFVIGDDDLKLAQKLIKAGNEHMKFMRMIHVQADINMGRYWWSEEDTYHFNTKNSCSTMHKLLNNDNPITRDLFIYCEEDLDVVDVVIDRLEQLRQEYKNTKEKSKQDRLLVRAKRLLMEGFLQLRTLDTNYAELRTEYFQRRHHRLKEEWQDVFCRWVESLPYAKELIMYEGNKKA